ncbi:hypothetical protein BKA62DRAFT_780208 [Auriculariales sp. MPI-PUGE-AT-0066]|nr:hypothetical protein BKA62DRAFT_780208 [Auriculariales sp. MPI-PUGE-AT-0066]
MSTITIPLPLPFDPTNLVPAGSSAGDRFHIARNYATFYRSWPCEFDRVDCPAYLLFFNANEAIPNWMPADQRCFLEADLTPLVDSNPPAFVEPERADRSAGRGTPFSSDRGRQHSVSSSGRGGPSSVRNRSSGLGTASRPVSIASSRTSTPGSHTPTLPNSSDIPPSLEELRGVPSLSRSMSVESQYNVTPLPDSGSTSFVQRALSASYTSDIPPPLQRIAGLLEEEPTRRRAVRPSCHSGPLSLLCRGVSPGVNSRSSALLEGADVGPRSGWRMCFVGGSHGSLDPRRTCPEVEKRKPTSWDLYDWSRDVSIVVRLATLLDRVPELHDQLKSAWRIFSRPGPALMVPGLWRDLPELEDRTLSVHLGDVLEPFKAFEDALNLLRERLAKHPSVTMHPAHPFHPVAPAL